jgi:RNA polymerase sigma-70 factor (ECF subfamily)
MANSEQLLWLLRAQSGDREALDKLIRAIQGQLHGYLINLVCDRHLADDLLQDVLVAVIQKLRWLREPTAFSAWVYRIASRHAFRALKARRKSTSVHDGDSICDSLAADASQEAADGVWIDRFEDVLELVSPASRAVLSLHYLREMTLQEVADVLQIPLGTTKARLAYGLRALRAKLNREDAPATAGPPGGTSRRRP